MRLLLQRVREASVRVNDQIISQINQGLLVFVGIEEADNEEDASWLAKKTISMRLFSDEKGLMNLSLEDVNGSLLVVSQFTLHALTKKGNRPSFIKAAPPEKAIPLYTEFMDQLASIVGKEKVKAGQFGADMQVSLINDGPVTIWIDSKQKA
ncbi:MAG: D-tyrosyl-tRNA(Tyr) deacylase [Bacteroidales bacterium]|nr:D-tyrosyl-tRNA(Tyr) deacylase [Bacteroidales bacterium]